MAKIREGSTLDGEPLASRRELDDRMIETNVYLGDPNGSEEFFITLVPAQEGSELNRDRRSRTQGMIVGARSLGSDYPSSGLFMVNAVKGGRAGSGEGASFFSLHNLEDFSSLVKVTYAGIRYIAIRLNPENINHRSYDAGVYFTGHCTHPEYLMLVSHSEGSNVEAFDGGDAVDAHIRGAGLQVDGSVSELSDARFKEEIQPIDDALKKIGEINGYTFLRHGDTERSTGVVAQEVQKVLPEAVKDSPSGLSVQYGNLAGLLIEGIKELKGEIETLKKDLE